jgi:hypothetical protein
MLFQDNIILRLRFEGLNRPEKSLLETDTLAYFCGALFIIILKMLIDAINVIKLFLFVSKAQDK